MGIIIGMSLNNGGNHDSVMNESNDTTINITLNNSENSTNDTISESKSSTTSTKSSQTSKNSKSKSVKNDENDYNYGTEENGDIYRENKKTGKKEYWFNGDGNGEWVDGY